MACKKEEYHLIGRLHIDENTKNNWKSLGKFLGVKINPIEETKGIFNMCSNELPKLKEKIKGYNNLNNTDFSIEGK